MCNAVILGYDLYWDLRNPKRWRHIQSRNGERLLQPSPKPRTSRAPTLLTRQPGDPNSTRAVIDIAELTFLWRWLCLVLLCTAACCRVPCPALTVRDSLAAMRQRGLLQAPALVFLRGPLPLTLADSCTRVAVSRKRTAWPRSLRGRICFA